MKKKIMLTGFGGQLGLELQATVPEWAQINAFDETSLNITNLAACMNEAQSLRPDWIINAAAYTDVEKAEVEPELAMRVNSGGTGNLAQAARTWGAGMVHVSTDFVFDGSCREPLDENKPVGPLNSYGASKLAGEKEMQSHLFDKAVIIRTSWLYSPYGKNFVKTILRLLKEKPFLTIIDDQIGVPTSVRSLAQVIWRAVELELNGLFHWCDAGQCSWYQFACEIQAQALELGLVNEKKEIRPILARDFPSKAVRPAYSVMSQAKLAKATRTDPLPWQNELQLVLQRLADSELT
ncbi:MAG: dTDP-4-dehydrorhamnose reductase [Candidatus Rifleibacteriota bacterium]